MAMTPTAFPSTLPVHSIMTVGFTVSDLAQSVAFFTEALAFTKVFDVTVADAAYERLTGVVGARLRVARVQLGEEIIELTQYISPAGGRPMPADSLSNDR